MLRLSQLQYLFLILQSPPNQPPPSIPACLPPCLFQFFMYLDRYHVKHQNLPTLQASGLTIFKDEIYTEIKEPVVQGKSGRAF